MTFTFAPTELATWTEGQWTTLPGSPIKGFGVDTRTLQAGEVFVALRTERRDGHDYLADARARGAAAAMVSRVVADPLPQLVVADPLTALRSAAAGWRARFPGRVVGVTGSVGKTSTKEFLAHLLGAAAFVTEANLNNLIGVPLMLLRIDPARHRFAVIEAGMSVPGELGLSAQALRPHLAIVTAVAAVHLEGVGSLAGVAREKASLVTALAPQGQAVLPASLLAWPDFAVNARRCVAVAFAGEPAPAVAPARLVQAAFLDDGQGGQSVSLDGEVFPLGSLSAGLARNAALALVAARLLEVPAAALAAVSAGWSAPAGRGSVHVEGEQTFYVDCYNASPASLLDAAAAFDRLASPGARLFVLGGMAELGADSVRLHRECGARLPLRAGDHVVAFGGDAPAFLTDLSCPGVRTTVADTLAIVTSLVAAHRGAVFLKGSRAFALERVLPSSVRAALTFH
jgi:UDP-N-acetylmuramoyl-tripeptide--D-alanyl-D-alanine ligase